MQNNVRLERGAPRHWSSRRVVWEMRSRVSRLRLGLRADLRRRRVQIFRESTWFQALRVSTRIPRDVKFWFSTIPPLLPFPSNPRRLPGNRSPSNRRKQFARSYMKDEVLLAVIEKGAYKELLQILDPPLLLLHVWICTLLFPLSPQLFVSRRPEGRQSSRTIIPSRRSEPRVQLVERLKIMSRCPIWLFCKLSVCVPCTRRSAVSRALVLLRGGLIRH